MPEPTQPLDLDAILTRAADVQQLVREDVPAMADEIRHLRADNARYRAAWQSARERAQAYGEGILRVVKDREAYQGWLKQAEARVAELERPAVEAKRNEIRQSFTDLISAAEEMKDYEGAFDVECRLRERKEQWAREDAAAERAARP